MFLDEKALAFYMQCFAHVLQLVFVEAAKENSVLAVIFSSGIMQGIHLVSLVKKRSSKRNFENFN
jgi:hydrogenase maturation factor HypF (carbamoyltransferase family)